MKSLDKSSPNPSTKNQQPKNLQQAVQSTISSFLSQRQSTNSDIALDIYRAIKDEAHLLLEGQKIHDALDADPFELTRVDIDTSLSSAALSLGSGNEEDSGNSAVSNDGEQDDADIMEKKKNGEVISRLKKILRVISCTRTATLDGYSSINAIVQLDNDGNMDQSSVNENIRLHFTFLREPQKRNNNDINGEGEMDTGEKEMGCCSSDKCGKSECDDAQLSGGNNNNNNNNASSKIAVDHHPAKRRKMISKDEENGDNDAVKDGEKESNKSDDKQVDGLVPKTIITYRIDYSVDYGKMEPLLGVDVYALGDIPSVEQAVPMFDDDDDDDDDDDNVGEGDKECAGSSSEDTNEVNNDTCCKRKECEKKNQSNHAEFEDIEISDNDDDGNTDIKNGGDRFGVYINPENVVAFLDRANMNLNEQSVFYLLLTFPFYEHEWDISGFLLSALFDDEGDDEEEEEGRDESNDVNGCKTSCCSGGQSSCCDG